VIHPARFVVTAVGGLLFGVIGPAEPYAPTTHAELGAVAVERSNLDAILKNQYGVDGGTSFAIDGQAIRTWIAIGATREDFPGIRSLNHFHSPLQAWADAGGPLGQSSVYWQQNPNQGLGGTWSWPMARQRFFDFLTLPMRASRHSPIRRGPWVR